MAALIARVRILVGNPGTDIISDELIQEFLDRHREEVRNAQLDSSPSIVNGQYIYDHYYAAVGDWEDDITFTNSSFHSVTPNTSETLAGHWVFDSTHFPPSGIFPPVHIAYGKTYDVYAAAADVADILVGLMSGAFDWSDATASNKLSQKFDHLVALALSLRGRGRAQVIEAYRSDENRNYW
jgi:hypothetical protein